MLRRRRLFDTDQESQQTRRTTRYVPPPDVPKEAPAQKLSLAMTHAHREGMRAAAAHPSKTHVQGDTMYLAGNFRQRNEEGLRRAYDSPDGTFVDGDTEYVAGTNPMDPRDLWADVLIPFNMTRYGHRYSQAEKTLKEHPEVTRLVGHSLGGATASALQKQYYGKRDLHVVGYGSPELKISSAPTPDTVQFRHGGDPISGLDGEAMNIGSSLDPLKAHAYTGYTEKPELPENAEQPELPENAPEALEENNPEE
jgi:hypothetical protein